MSEAEPTRQIIHDSEHVLVIAQKLESDVLFVTFNEMGFRPDGDHFWGDSFMAALGYDSVGVVSKHTNFYPPDDAAIYIAKIREIAGGRPVFTYGFSHGGYGALKYSRALGATAAITFSPQWSMEPDDLRDFDFRGVGYHNPTLRNGERIKAEDICPRCYVVVDPAEPTDSFHARHIAELPGVIFAVAPFTSHDSIRLVTESRLSRQLLTDVVENPAFGARELRALVRSGRTRSRTYWEERSRRLLRRLIRNRNVERQSAFLREAIDDAPGGPDKSLMKCVFACIAGDTAKAESELAGLSDAQLSRAHDLLPFWDMFRTLAFRPALRRIAPALLASVPNVPGARLNLIAPLLELEMNAEVEAELEAMVEQPEAEEQAAEVIKHALAVHRPDLADRIVERLYAADHLPIADKVRISFAAFRVHQLANDRRGAFRRLRKIEEMAPDDDELLRQVSANLLEIGEISHALHILRKVADRSPEDTLRQLRVYEAMSLINSEDAISELGLYTRRTKLSAPAWELAALIYDRTEDRKRAMKAMQNALQLAPNNPSYIHGFARYAFANGHRRDAVRELKRATTLDLRNVEALRKLGNLSHEMKEPSLYVEFAEQQFRFGRQDPGSWHYAIRAYTLTKHPQQAEQLADQMMDMLLHNPNYPEEHWAYLARQWLELRLVKAATRAHRLASARFPHSNTLRKLAADLALMGRFAA